MPFLEIATDLVNRGFSVIPIEARGKRPIPGFGVTHRTKDLATVARWAEGCPDANVAICADENIVILESDDCDALWVLIESGTGKSVPVTLTACGSSTNRPHLFFKRTEMATNVSNLGVAGLFEARFNNQYVVAPGSIHPDGSTYRWLNDAPIVEIPEWLVSELARLALTQKTTRKVHVTVAEGQKLGEGEGRHYLIRDFCAKNCTPGKSIEQQFEEAMKFNHAHCDPPHDAAHVASIVNWFEDKEPHDPGVDVVLDGKVLNTAPGPRNPNGPRKSQFIIPLENNPFDGWFVRGEINLVVAPSGTGKTTVMLQILESLRKGESVFGHPAVQADYYVLMRDRSQKGFHRTVARMRLDKAAIDRVHRMTREELAMSPGLGLDSFLKKREVKGLVPDVVFFEGMDLWLPKTDVNNPDTVKEFITEVQEVAELWDVAVVGSVGTPKQKPKDKYMLQRENVLGTQVWGRMVENIHFMELSSPDNPRSARKMTVLLRNAPAEIFHLDFQDGLLIQVDDPDKEDDHKEPDGVADTRKIDKQAEIIGVLELLPPGTILQPEVFIKWGKRSTFDRLMADLAHPQHGWVEKDPVTRKWIVKNRQLK